MKNGCKFLIATLFFLSTLPALAMDEIVSNNSGESSLNPSNDNLTANIELSGGKSTLYFKDYKSKMRFYTFYYDYKEIIEFARRKEVEVGKLKKEYDDLKTELTISLLISTDFKDENKSFEHRNKYLEHKNEDFEKENDDLNKENEKLLRNYFSAVFRKNKKEESKK